MKRYQFILLILAIASACIFGASYGDSWMQDKRKIHRQCVARQASESRTKAQFMGMVHRNCKE